MEEERPSAAVAAAETIEAGQDAATAAAADDDDPDSSLSESAGSAAEGSSDELEDKVRKGENAVLRGHLHRHRGPHVKLQLPLEGNRSGEDRDSIGALSSSSGTSSSRTSSSSSSSSCNDSLLQQEQSSAASEFQLQLLQTQTKDADAMLQQHHGSKLLLTLLPEKQQKL